MSINFNNKNILNITWITFCASFFLVVFGPLSIFINNTDDFTINLISLVSILSIIAGIIFLALTVLMVILPENLSHIFARFIALITLSSWFISSFLYGDYGNLDGKELNINLWGRVIVYQIVALTTLLIFVSKVKIDIIYKSIYFIFFVGIISVVMGILNLDKEAYVHNKTGFHLGMTDMSSKKNVLHVILDALQPDLFLSAIESNQSLKAKFDGFTFFKNTLSVYPSTEMSIPMLITGEIYRNQQSKKEFLSKLKKQNLGIKNLEGIGFKLDAHTICKDLITPCTPISPQVIGKTAQFSEVILLLDIYIFKSMPDWLKPFIYNQGNWLLLNNININDYLKIPLVGLGHLIFTKFIEELHVTEDSIPRYKFFHSLVTHDPARLDASCRIVQKEQLSSLSRVEFAKCGIRHFVHLLDKLKTLGIYDETMIILSSDHGAGYNDGKFNEAFIERGINYRIVGLASATLLIKPYNKHGKIQISEAPVSLRDIPKTIITANGINTEAEGNKTFPPRDILNMIPADGRTREYLHYTWEHEFWNELKLPPITVYPINGHIKDPLSWPYSLNVTGELTCNLQVLFNKPLSDVKALYGLSGIEHWGRWTDSHKAMIVFNANTTKCSQNELSLKLKGFVTKKNKTQHAKVLLNGTQIGSVIINLGEQNPREFVFSISPELIKQGQMNRLEFDIDKPVSPKSVSVNNDIRLLGLGFESMVFQ